MNIKVGQTWRNRVGHVVTVREQTPQGFMMERDEADKLAHGYTVNAAGVSRMIFDRGLDLEHHMLRVYISGPMTGLPESNYPAFNAAAADYRKRGAFVVNPVEVCAHLPIDSDWTDYMRPCMAALMTCEMVVLLDGWTKSKGARLEHHTAREMGFAIAYPANEIHTDA